jgi:hypothetical protein
MHTLKEKDNSEKVDVDGTIILKWMLREYDGNLWTEFIWLRICTRDHLL